MPSRVIVRVLALTLLMTGCVDPGPSAPKQAKKEAPVKSGAKESEPTPAPKPDPVVKPEPAPPEPTTAVAPEPPPEPESPPEPEVAPPPAPTPAKSGDPRDPSVIPPGTPAANAKAFSKLPVAKGDGPPVGGIGVNGIHIDTLEIGKGWFKSKCDQPTTVFTSGVDEKVNVCMRIIHPRVTEELTIYWEHNGKLNQRSKVNVQDIHAYLTRGWLPITPDRIGKWKATIKTADGTVLGEVQFEIK
jgi:hypothetical protein